MRLPWLPIPCACEFGRASACSVANLGYPITIVPPSHLSPDTLYRRIYPYFRGRRLDRFAASFALTPATTVLDVGGCPAYWQYRELPGRLTILNLPVYGPPVETPRWKLIHGDGTSLGFPDGSFDIAHSNSVLEHLSTWERQQIFAREIRRVGRGVWVQSPARSFPVECHTFDPLVHWLPKSWRRHLLRHATLWGWLKRPTQQEVDDFLATTRLPSFDEMRRLFPDCQILRERFAGLTKSYIAYRPAPASDDGAAHPSA